MKSPLRRLMVPLDGSPQAQQALAIGAGIARREGADLRLVTVIAPVSTWPIEAGSFAPDTVEHALHEGFRRYLEEQAEAVRRLEPGVTVSGIVLDGSIADALAQYAGAEDIDLIVMTTHGWGRLKRLWLGSVAQSLVHRVHCPTLLMRPADQTSSFGLHRILVALGSADDADAMLEPALALGGLVDGAQYTLLQVIELEPSRLLRLAGIPGRTASEWIGEIAEQTDRRLDRVASRLRHRGITADARVLIERGAGEQILRFARRSGCDLIVIGTRATGLERAMFGSVADKVVRGATQMVLVVPLRIESTRAAAKHEGSEALAGATGNP